MQIRVFADEAAVADALAAMVTAVVRERPRAVLGLPTGRTPVLLYKALVARASEGTLDMSNVTTFNLDEFLALPATHPGSYRYFMEHHLFGNLGARRPRVQFLDGSAQDADAECARYEAVIAEAGGIDLQILGLGTNGHIGFNEPGPELAARTHRVTLRPETRRSNAGLFDGDADRVPREALSMGMATILQARRIVVLATGPSKAGCVRQMIEGPLTTMLPASFLQLHDDVEVMLDQAAARDLNGGDAGATRRVAGWVTRSAG
jgi:glucosamine-6-phosphate deaminase